jgi:hypothetical protein
MAACGVVLTDMTGMTFGSLTVVRRAPKESRKDPKWECLCACGRTHITRGVSLRKGDTRSCGCVNGSNKYGTAEESNTVRIYAMYESGARKRGHEWRLTLQQLRDIVASPCIYCGAPPEERPSRWKRSPTTRSSGIDRVDNSQGYVIGNVVPCCTWCNMSKRQHSMLDFVTHCRAVAARFPEVGL